MTFRSRRKRRTTARNENHRRNYRSPAWLLALLLAATFALSNSHQVAAQSQPSPTSDWGQRSQDWRDHRWDGASGTSNAARPNGRLQWTAPPNDTRQPQQSARNGSRELDRETVRANFQQLTVPRRGSAGQGSVSHASDRQKSSLSDPFGDRAGVAEVHRGSGDPFSDPFGDRRRPANTRFELKAPSAASPVHQASFEVPTNAGREPRRLPRNVIALGATDGTRASQRSNTLLVQGPRLAQSDEPSLDDLQLFEEDQLPIPDTQEQPPRGAFDFEAPDANPFGDDADIPDAPGDFPSRPGTFPDAPEPTDIKPSEPVHPFDPSRDLPSTEPDVDPPRPDTAPSDPIPTDPTPTDPIPTEPIPSDPTPSEPLIPESPFDLPSDSTTPDTAPTDPDATLPEIPDPMADPDEPLPLDPDQLPDPETEDFQFDEPSEQPDLFDPFEPTPDSPPDESMQFPEPDVEESPAVPEPYEDTTPELPAPGDDPPLLDSDDLDQDRNELQQELEELENRLGTPELEPDEDDEEGADERPRGDGRDAFADDEEDDDEDDEMPCDRVYDERNCCEQDDECRTAWERLANRPVTDISLDITPPFAPLPEDEEEADSDLQKRLASAPSRIWRNRSGQPVANGMLQDYRDGQVIVSTVDGRTVAVPYLQLSHDDLCFITAYWGLPGECTVMANDDGIRDWRLCTFTWKAAANCHKPLYFEDVQLERYGHSAGPCLQPLVTTAHFFGNVLLLPYNMGTYPPNECRYPLGHFRPGSCAPWLVPAFPLSERGAKAELITLLILWGFAA